MGPLCIPCERASLGPCVQRTACTTRMVTVAAFVLTLPDGPCGAKKAPTVGIEPTTTRLKAERSTTELGGPHTHQWRGRVKEAPIPGIEPGSSG